MKIKEITTDYIKANINLYLAIHIASERVWDQNWQGRQSKDFKETI